jgi:hypothetical protein
MQEPTKKPQRKSRIEAIIDEAGGDLINRAEAARLLGYASARCLTDFTGLKWLRRNGRYYFYLNSVLAKRDADTQRSQSVAEPSAVEIFSAPTI